MISREMPSDQRFGGSVRRRERWLDLLATLKERAFVALAIAAGFLLVFGVLVVLTALITFSVHLFIPPLGWLDAEEWSRLTSWYSGLSQIALPVLLILNPWVIWRLTRDYRNADRDSS